MSLGHGALSEFPLSTGTGPPTDPTIPAGQVVVQSTRLFCPELQLLLPDFNFREDDTGDLQRFVVEVLQPVLELLCAEAQRYVDQNDVDLADELTVDAMLRDLGNPYVVAFTLAVNRKRLLVRNLVTIYKKKGTVPSLVEVIRALTGIESTIITPATLSAWILGVEVLGDTSADPPILDPDNTDLAILDQAPSYLLYSFQVSVDRVLTPEERQTLEVVIDLTKPAHTHFVGFTEPEVPVVIDHWELGLSALHATGEPIEGDEVDLHE